MGIINYYHIRQEGKGRLGKEKELTRISVRSPVQVWITKVEGLQENLKKSPHWLGLQFLRWTQCPLNIPSGFFLGYCSELWPSGLLSNNLTIQPFCDGKVLNDEVKNLASRTVMTNITQTFATATTFHPLPHHHHPYECESSVGCLWTLMCSTCCDPDLRRG